jgi:hypothetical protein
MTRLPVARGAMRCKVLSLVMTATSRRWPESARQILKDCFTEHLDRMLRSIGQRETLAATQKKRHGLRQMLDNVLIDTRERVRSREKSFPHNAATGSGEGGDISPEHVRRVCGTKKLSLSSLPFLLRSLFADGVLTLRAQEDQNLAKELSSAFNLRDPIAKPLGNTGGD